jgi:hypothetical protein
VPTVSMRITPQAWGAGVRRTATRHAGREKPGEVAEYVLHFQPLARRLVKRFEQWTWHRKRLFHSGSGTDVTGVWGFMRYIGRGWGTGPCVVRPSDIAFVLSPNRTHAGGSDRFWLS